MEKTSATPDEVRPDWGSEIARIVVAVSDDRPSRATRSASASFATARPGRLNRCCRRWGRQGHESARAVRTARRGAHCCGDGRRCPGRSARRRPAGPGRRRVGHPTASATRPPIPSSPAAWADRIPFRRSVSTGPRSAVLA